MLLHRREFIFGGHLISKISEVNFRGHLLADRVNTLAQTLDRVGYEVNEYVVFGHGRIVARVHLKPPLLCVTPVFGFTARNPAQTAFPQATIRADQSLRRE